MATGRIGTVQSSIVYDSAVRAPYLAGGRIEMSMLWFIVVLLVVLWLLGLIGGIGGNLIYLLLVLAAIVLIFNLLFGRRYV